MATSDERIRLLLEARNNASAALNQVQGQLAGLNKAAGIAATGMTAIASAAAISGIVQLGGAIYDLAQNAANFAAVRSSFEGLAAGVGQSADGMLSAMRRASSGMVSDSDLILSANRAMLLGVADSGEEMGTLLEIARVRGRAMGLDVSQAFNDMVTGLGRMSPMILDNLGITVDLEAATSRYAQSLGVTAESLTDAQRKQALLNTVIESSKELLEGNASEGDAMASSFERAEASIANMKLELGALFSPAVAAIAQSIADTVSSMTDVMQRQAETATNTQERLNQALNEYNDRLQVANQFSNDFTGILSGESLRQLDLAKQKLGELVYEYNLLASKKGQPIINLEDLISGDPYFVALEQYDPAAFIERQLDEARTASNAVMASWASDMQGWQSTIGEITRQVFANSEGLSNQQIQSLIASYTDFFNTLTSQGYTAAEAMAYVKGRIAESADAMRDLNEAATGATQGISTLGQAAPIAAHGVSTLGIEAATAAANLGVLMNAMGALQGVQNLSKARDAIDGAFGSQDARAGWADVRQEMGRVGEEGVKGAKASADIAQSMYMSYNNTKAMGGAASQVNQEFNALKGTVAGILQGSLTLDGIKVDDMLPREDEINENARRLAAIANEGLIGQDWFGEFAAEVPDIAKMLQESGDPRAAAQQLLRDFQDGLVPELLDKDMAKERVKRMILGQENMAALANEIALELSREMGISLSQAQAAVSQTLGTGGAATGVDGKGAPLLDGTSEGNKFVDGLTTQITVRQASIMQSGASSGATWGMGFMETVTANVPTALIELLVVLITPGVKKKLSDEGSRTGAR